MSNKYEPGSFLVQFFDRYGTKIKDKAKHVGSLVAGKEYGKENAGEDESFVVTRTLYNSLNPRNVWQ